MTDASISQSGAASAPHGAASGGEDNQFGGCSLHRGVADAAHLGPVCNRIAPLRHSHAASANPGAAPRKRGKQGNGTNQPECVSSQNLAGAASAAPAPLRAGSVWSRQDEARLLDLHGECDGDWRKVATKLQRTTLECRVRYRQLMMLKPAKVEVERKCLFCQRVKMIEKPNRICAGCRETEERRNASAWQ